MKEGDDCQELWRAANLLGDFEEPLSAHQVKSLGEVHEGEEQWLLLLSTLLLQMMEGEIVSTVDLPALKPHCDSE